LIFCLQTDDNSKTNPTPPPGIGIASEASYLKSHLSFLAVGIFLSIFFPNRLVLSSLPLLLFLSLLKSFVYFVIQGIRSLCLIFVIALALPLVLSVDIWAPPSCTDVTVVFVVPTSLQSISLSFSPSLCLSLPLIFPLSLLTITKRIRERRASVSEHSRK
jgi:hypothetical protein